MSEALCRCVVTKFHGNPDTSNCQIHGTPTPTREPIRLTAEERAKFFKMLADYKRNWITTSNAVQAVESILAARLAGGPTLADAACEKCNHWHDEQDRCAYCDCFPIGNECDNGQANTCRHLSASGMDTSSGPGKVWRCDHCGLCWIEGYSPHAARTPESEHTL